MEKMSLLIFILVSAIDEFSLADHSETLRKGKPCHPYKHLMLPQKTVTTICPLKLVCDNLTRVTAMTEYPDPCATRPLVVGRAAL